MSNQTFEIGFVGAGAISAGAYTGGVIDFIVYALDNWYATKGVDKLAPPHEVKLSVFSGASAGGITAALAAAYLGSDQPSVTNLKEASSNNGQNKLFDSWVDRIDISSLLESRDLDDKQSPVVSLLDSSILTEIAKSGLNVKPRTKRRPYVAENFELLLTVTNLRGVPYAIPVISYHPASYNMSLHADYVHFRINDSGKGGMSDRYTMSWNDFGKSSPIIEKLQLSALASGAFPIGLAPRTLDYVIPGNGQDWYSSRKWPIPSPHSHDPHQCTSAENIPVSWGKLAPPYQFNFQCVDGGVMNNEPLELARQILAGPQGRNAREGELAEKAILLIDPFPSNSSFDTKYAAAPDMLKTAFGLVGALLRQARFKPDELMLAAREDVYSRFMIAPSREGEAHPIACGALGGFGGFFKREFRLHDYFLGRRNAQKFLNDHFVLPEKNPLFTEWTEEMKEAHCVRDSFHQPKTENGQRFLPIIPLVGVASVVRSPCYKAEWPRYTAEDLGQLIERVETRVDVVIDHMVKQYFKSLFVRFFARIVLRSKKKDVVEFVQQKVSADLNKMQLMR